MTTVILASECHTTGPEFVLMKGAVVKARIDLKRVAPGVIQPMLGLERQVRQTGFDAGLLNRVQTQTLHSINGRAYCLDIHTKDAVSSRRPASTDCDGLNARSKDSEYQRHGAADNATADLVLGSDVRPCRSMHRGWRHGRPPA